MKIAVLVSGGVDSSVALRLLQQQGHQVTAFYLKIWLEDELSFLGTCPWEEDLSFVRAVCEQAGVPLEIISLQKEYWQEVVAYTIASVKQGLTPNPDVMCNQRIKFGAFYKAIGQEYDKIATGHYAQVVEKDGLSWLATAPDPIKDQTYFLSQLSQDQLARAVFPIGHLMKSQVRELAEQFQLPNRARKDSQGICFLGKLKFREFIKYHVGEQLGPIIEFETGKSLGEHKGFWFHTIGQRQGLGLSGGPWFVVDKDSKENKLFVSRSYHEEGKKRDSFCVGAPLWIAQGPAGDNLSVKLRHGPERYPAQISFDEKGDMQVRLPRNDQGIAAGQFAVFYQDDICLGGGVILHD
jgi:tRNA (5-methylaminomethyl-2-thiouridylate)-methyltransferase